MNLNDESIDEVFKYFNIQQIYTVNYARTGLTILLQSISKIRKIKVGVQVYTCHTIFEAINLAGCDIIFLDVNNNFTIDLENLRSKIESIDVLIVTHTFGIPADLYKIMEIAKDKIIIEDCAHALFTCYSNKQVGKFCDASIFSIGYGKYPSIGSGGLVLINNQELLSSFLKKYEQLPEKSDINELKNVFRNILYSLAHDKLFYGLVTYPLGKSLDIKYDFLGKKHVLCTKSYKTNINVFNKNIQKYYKLSRVQVSNGEYVASQLNKKFNLAWSQQNYPNYYIFPLLSIKRDIIIANMRAIGVESGKHFAKAVKWAALYGYKLGDCPNSERIASEILTIPVHYTIKQQKLKKICEVILNSAVD